MLRDMNIGNRLTLIVLGINVSILIFIAVVATTSSDAALRQQAITRFNLKSREANTTLLETFQGMEAILNEVANAVSQVDLNDSIALREAMLSRLYTLNNRHIYRFAVYRPDARVSLLRLRSPLLPNAFEFRTFIQRTERPTQEIFYQPLQTNRPVWIKQERSFYDTLRQPAVTIGVPFTPRGSTQPEGIVWGDIPISTLQQLVNNALDNEGLLTEILQGYAILVDGNNQLLTQHNLYLRSSDIPQNVEQILSQTQSGRQAGNVTEVNDPVTGLDAFINVNNFLINGWRLITTLPTNEVPTVPLTIIPPIAVVSFLGVLILVWAINRFMVSAVGLPLERLGTAAQGIGGGDLRYYVPFQDRGDEIGRLAFAMEDMRRSLAYSHDELSRWSRTLELRVADRTKEVEQARRDAQASADELTAVYTESLVVVNESKLTPVLEAFTHRIRNLLNASYVGVWLLTEDRERVQLVYSSIPNRDTTLLTIKVGEGIAGQAIAQGVPVIVEDHANYPHRVLLYDEQDGPPFDIALSVPLQFVGKPIGAVVVGRREDDILFDEDDLRMLNLFANLVSPSVRNAQLYVQMNQAFEEADRANQVKTRFLASVTHELRTPLNLIINNLDFMRVGAFGEVTNEQLSRLNQTVRSAEHLLYLINDLLDVSKIEAGEMQLFIQPNDIETMLDDTIDNAMAFMDKIDGKQDAVKLITEVPENLPQIPMDVRRVRQVLTNLLTNAIKFTEAGEVKLVVKTTLEGVQFSVSDTGMGIPEDEAHKLFQAFERTEMSKAQNIEGTGLGLPISKFLVEQHGGNLTFSSTVGVGTTFTFTLPLTTPSISDSQRLNRSDPTIAALLSSKEN